MTTQSQPAAGVPQFDHDPYSDEVGHNPYPYYKKMRDAGPLCWLSRYGVYVSTSDAIVRQGLTDWRHFSSAKGIGLFKKKAVNEEKDKLITRKAGGLLEYDPPEHGAARRVMVDLLSNRAVADLRNSFQAAAVTLVDELLERGTVDAVKDIGRRYVMGVVGDAVGLPREGREHLYIFGELAMNLPGPLNQRYERALAAVEAAGSRPWIASMAARERLSSTGFGAQLYEKADSGEITQEDAASLIGSFLFAAVDSTTLTLINGLHAFTQAPEQWQVLRADPGRARQAFDEILRLVSAPQTLFRTTTEQVEIAGVTLPADQKIGFSLAGANRDPERWADPDRFDINRKVTQHLAFGAGIHTCVGQMLAKLEAECLLGEMAARISAVELAGEPVRFANNAMSSFSALPLRLTA